MANRGFALLTLGYGVNTFGNWATVVAAVGLLAFKWQASPLALAGLIAVFIGPSAVLAPVAGWAADRWSKKRLLVVANLLAAALILGMLAVQEIWQVYLLLFALRAITSVNQPAMAALVPGLVPRRQIAVANSLILQPAHLTRALSPVLAGVLIAALDTSGAFVFNAVTYAASALIISRITVGEADRLGHAADAAARALSGVGGVLSGVRESLTSTRIAVLLLLATAGAFASGAIQSIIPVYTRELLDGAPLLYGASISALGAGSVLGALAAGRLGRTWDRLAIVTAAIVATAGGLLLIAGVHAPAPFLLGVGLAGFGAGTALTGGQTLVHEETPAETHGTVLGAVWGIANAFTLAGIFLAGLLLGPLGIAPTSFALAASLLAIALAASELARKHKRREASRSAADLGEQRL